ncbi:hypothetical protein BJX96DRAFT_47341 [Aspergillus floccosus]
MSPYQGKGLGKGGESSCSERHRKTDEMIGIAPSRGIQRLQPTAQRHRTEKRGDCPNDTKQKACALSTPQVQTEKGLGECSVSFEACLPFASSRAGWCQLQFEVPLSGHLVLWLVRQISSIIRRRDKVKRSRGRKANLPRHLEPGPSVASAGQAPG